MDSAARDCPTVRLDRRDGTTPPPSHEMGKMGRKGKECERNGKEKEMSGMEWTTGDRVRIYFMKESLRKKIIACATCRIMVSMSDS